jgi:hypothetical protein
MEGLSVKAREVIFTVLAFFGGLSVAYTILLRGFNPQPSDPTITVTNMKFGTATIQMRTDREAVRRLKAVIDAINGSNAPVDALVIKPVRIILTETKTIPVPLPDAGNRIN